MSDVEDVVVIVINNGFDMCKVGFVGEVVFRVVFFLIVVYVWRFFLISLFVCLFCLIEFFYIL